MKREELITIAKREGTKDADMLVTLIENDQPLSSIQHYLELKADLDIELRRKGYDGSIE